MGLSLQQALIVALAILITFAVAKMLIDRRKRILTQKSVASANNISNVSSASKTSTNFMNTHKDNTLEHRPGSRYVVDVHRDPMLPPAYVIKLIYKPGCDKHHLSMLFEYIAKQMTADGTAAASHIEFQREVADPMLPCNIDGIYPKVIKIRRSGQVMEYTGHTDYGPLSDWILNEQILF